MFSYFFPLAVTRMHNDRNRLTQISTLYLQDSGEFYFAPVATLEISQTKN
jgi:hypothetical protein